jgi:hypothetical protein
VSTRHQHPALKILSAPMPPEYFSQQATTNHLSTRSDLDDAGLDFGYRHLSRIRKFFYKWCMNIDQGTDASASQSPLWSLAPVKIAPTWRIFNDIAACQK